MPYRKPLIKKGARESPRLHYLKLCWFEVHFEDVTEQISRKHFIENFFEYAESMGLYEKIESLYGIKWDFYNKDGTPKEYNYTVLDKQCIFSRYDWNSQYPIFKIDKLKTTHDSACERVERSKDKHTLEDLQDYEYVSKRIKKLQSMEEAGYEGLGVELNRLDKQKSRITERISRRLGLDELNVNVDGKLDVDAIIQEGTYTVDEINELQKVSSKPDKDTQRFLDQL